MPKLLGYEKTCMECLETAGGKDCDIRARVSEKSLYDVIDPIFKNYFGVEVYYTFYELFIMHCDNFKSREVEDPTVLALNKAMNGEELTEEEQNLIASIMQEAEGGG